MTFEVYIAKPHKQSLQNDDRRKQILHFSSPNKSLHCQISHDFQESQRLELDVKEPVLESFKYEFNPQSTNWK